MMSSRAWSPGRSPDRQGPKERREIEGGEWEFTSPFGARIQGLWVRRGAGSPGLNPETRRRTLCCRPRNPIHCSPVVLLLLLFGARSPHAVGLLGE